MTAPTPRPPRLATLAATLASVLASASPASGASQEVAAPEVVRLRVSGETLSEWFPGRDGLTTLNPERFEELVRSAREAVEDREASRLVEPLRVEHRVRLDGGDLVGTTVLRFPDPGDGPRWAALWPWSPAVDSVAPASCALVHRDEDGRAFLRLAFGDSPTADATRTVELSWRLRPRVEAEGRIFDLELVEGPATAMILDLPEGMTPSGPPGYREGPEPTGEPGRRRWRFDGPGGAVVLRFRSAPDPDRPSGPWIGGATLVEIDDERPATLGGAARWTASWEIDPGPEGHRPLEVALGPGIGWEEVSGPEGAVAGVEAVPSPDGTRLTVRWRDGLTGPTRLVLTGLAPIDDPAHWPVPLAEPVGAQWTGGVVVVRLGQSWSLVDCRERSGRRLDLEDVPAETWQALQGMGPRSGQGAAPDLEPVLSPATVADGGTALAFFADRPSPVAELHLSPSRGVVSASVRGTVRLRDGADTLEAEVDVEPTPEDATLVRLELSPGWAPEAARLADGLPVPRWEQEVLDDGRRIVRAHLPGGLDVGDGPGAGLPDLIISAVRIHEDSRELGLPRLRPIGPAVAEERWAILGGPGVALRPIEAEGLAWLDPTTPAAAPSPTSDVRALLAWRWTTPGGRGRVAREAVPARPSVVVGQRATIVGGRLSIDWDLRLDPRGEAIRTLPYRVVPAPSGTDGPSWTLVAADGRAARLEAEASAAGGAFELRIPRDATGVVSLAGHLELPWNGEGPLPVLDLPLRFEVRGALTLRVAPELACETLGDLSFRDLDPGRSTSSAEATPGEPTRLAGAFLYDGRPGSLVVRTTPLPASPPEGAVLRADLSSWPTDMGVTRHRLSLDVVAHGATTLGVELPAGSTIVGAWCEGRPAEAFVEGETTRIPLRPPGDDGSPTARPCRVVLDYQRPGGGDEVEPDRPRFTMPCLSFSWRLALPADRDVSAVGPALTSADPGPDRRGWLPGLELGRLRDPSASERAMLDRLDERAAAEPADGRTLGELVASWDLVRWPLVIDRAALEAEGLGPRSAVPSGEGGGPAGRPTRGASRNALSPMGLLVVPIDTVLLVTSLVEVPRFAPNALGGGADRDAWVRALREAVIWGADRAGRFETVERWRASSGGVAAGLPDAVGPRSEARAVRRFVASGWPSRGVGVRSVDRWPWLAAGLVPAALVLLGAWVRLPGRGWAILRVVLLLVVAVASGLVASRGGPGPAAAAVAPFYAGLVGSVIAPLRRRPRPDRGDPAGSTVVRSYGSASRVGAGASGGLVLIAALGGAQSVPTPEGQAPIVAFLPEPGTGDDGATVTSIWMRDADLRRLIDAAAPPRPADVGQAGWPLVGAVAASHDLRPDGDGNWTLETRLTLRFEADGAATWSLPIDRPTLLEATFDGQARPVLIEPTADRANVAIDGPAGTHELVIRQRVRPQDDAGGRRLRFPVNPVATATLDIAEGPDATDPTLARSLGPTSIGPDGGLRAAIGPIDRVEVDWERPGGDGPGGSPNRVEGLLLWRALPAADRLDARLTVRGPGPVRELWFAVEPGVAVRSARADGAIVEGSRVVADDGDRWIARIDPPLPDGGVLEVELWRPRDDDGADDRRPPRLEPMGVARYDGRIALMRPGSWGGRLGSEPADGPISEQEFEQDWGPLPRGDALDPAGAARFVGPPSVDVPLGPSPPRRRVVPTLQLDLDAGRWEWRLAAEVADLDGRSIREQDVVIPAELELIEVEANGLTAWDRPAPDRLRLRFDGPAGSAREVALGGWLPLPTDPMDPGPLVADRPLPWPEWPGASAEEGLLLLSSPSTALFEYFAPDGTPRPIDRLATSNNRLRYQSIEVDEPGLLHVESFPAVTVELWSQLVVGGRSARWEALVRYQVTGGPADRIELILPDAWSEGVEFELDGLGPVSVRELGEQAEGDLVEIDPGRPIWGAANLRIRSTRPLEADQPMGFPALVPWGRGGTVSRHTIAVVVPADRAPGLEFSGLEPADSATRDQLSSTFPASPLPEANRTVYSVRREDWSLVVRPAATPPDLPPDAGEARVDLAELSCAIAPDGTARGHASYELRPLPAPFLTLHAPPGAAAVAAVVDGRAVRPRLGPPGRWVIPLGDGPARRVELAWIDPAPADARRRLGIPQPIQDGVTVLATISCEEGDSVEASGGQTVPSPAAAGLVERLDRAGEGLRDRLERISPVATAEDRDALLAEVARFLALRRHAERSAYWAALMHPDTAEVVRQRGPLRRIVAARETLDGALLAAGLPGLLASVPPSADPGPPTDWLSPLLPGVPRHFRSTTEADRPISFDWTPGDAR